ncbi:MAG: integral rane sensor hybrid histidine kinase [Caulobacter sp.]|nr:integral rane sensor hybrid histidine kinase [Caulobacter sp.]
MNDLMRRIGGSIFVTPVIAVGIAVALLIASFSLAVQNERLNRAEKVRQVTVQANILAGSVAAPLFFDDDAAAKEYVSALRANPDVEAAGAYGAAGRLAAGFSRTAPLPPANAVGAPLFVGGDLIVTAPVMQDGKTIGSVYLRTATETFPRRALRYLGIALIMTMASLLVAVLGASFASVSRAHRALQLETAGREKAEEALRQSQKMEAMGQLTGGVAHDFNNLLMVASSGLDLMQRTTDPARRERLQAGIRQAIERGASLTQQLLAFSRRSPLNPEVLDLPSRMEGMHALLDRSLREDVFVDIKAEPGLWRVEVDPSQFEVAVLNISLNARDAMPKGGAIVIRMENLPVDAGRSGDMVRVSITDTGVGVPAEMIPRLFEPFFTTKDVGQGTGLGLSQVYGFARASGGEVTVDSVVGKGTTVSLLLPRSLKSIAVEPAPRAAVVDNASRRRRLLVVEDDDAVADLVTEMLDELGYDAVRAPTASGALDTLGADSRFDLVFSDMVMPGEMGGLDLAREIGRRRPDLPIILTTGYSAAAAAVQAEGLRLLVKPYRIDALAEELQAALPRE